MGSTIKGKNLLGSKFFPFTVDPISEQTDVQEIDRKLQNESRFWKMAEALPGYEIP